MQKQEWKTALCMLCVLAVMSVGLSSFALYQNQPERVAAFENRFLDLTELGITAAEGTELSVSERNVTFSWSQDAQTVEMSTAIQPLPEDCQNWQITLGGGGQMNGVQKDLWGYQAWLELRLYRGETMIAAERTEMPLLAERADRTRIYTVQAKAEGADGWQLCALITPVEGSIAEGSLLLNNWEVKAR